MAPSTFSRSNVRRPAKHRPADPHRQYGVAGPRQEAFTNGGEVPLNRSTVKCAAGGPSSHGSQVCSLAVIVSTCQPLSVSLKRISYRTPPHPYSGCMYPIPTETL